MFHHKGTIEIQYSYPRPLHIVSQTHSDVNPTHQKTASPFGGLATPPGTLQTSLVRKKLQRFSFLQCSANFSKSNNSPIGIPQPPRRTSCRA